ncbi:hypothetical protein [Hyphobacterium sp.]|uniref:hypothetical protein n=1 Tax=Hyphobacterium sp. TaxID=2004662 RepID=UPI003BAAE0EE
MSAEEKSRREGLEEFNERFGALSERMKDAVEPENKRENMPLAETQERKSDRSAGERAYERPGPEFLPGRSSKPDFENAVNAKANEKRGQADGSQMIKDDAPRNNLSPPENSRSVDREAHQQRMATDDKKSRRGISDEYISKALERTKGDAYERERALDRSQNNDGQTYERGR